VHAARHGNAHSTGLIGRLRQTGRRSLDQKFVIPELDFVTPLGFSDGFPDVVNCDCIHTVAPQVFDVSLDQIDAALCAIMITASHAGDYQHAAEELVGIERKALSVFVLHRPKSPI
jgi:hypothetical protein